MLATATFAAEPNFPITSQQRATAQKAAETGVPLSEMLPNAPDIYTVKPRDTLWDISKLYLKSPWRWPELWGMNLEQVRNPHLIFPGQVLFLDKSNGRARLRMGAPVGGAGDAGLSPRVRSRNIALDGIASIPFNLIEPFLNEAVIFETNELASAPRIVATQEGRVLLVAGDTAYVRGDLGQEREYRIFREPRPLRDPTTKEVLGYEARLRRRLRVHGPGRDADRRPRARPRSSRRPSRSPASARKPASATACAPVPAREYTNYAPHPPAAPIAGQIVSIYGDALTAGQNQIVALNRGAVDGIERGHVLALFRDGKVDRRPDREGPHQDQAARRAARRAVRVPRLQPHVVRADPVGEGPGLARRPLHPAVDSPAATGAPCAGRRRSFSPAGARALGRGAGTRT